MSASANRVWKARAGLLALFAIFFLPVLASVVLVISKPGWTPFGTVNRGDLIDPPRQLPTDADGGGMQEAGFPEHTAGKWLLVHLASGQCADACVQSLVAIRQARIALGKEADRVERVWLVTADGPTVRMQEVLEMFPGLGAFRADPALAGLFPDRSQDSIYVIDPAGRLVLRYEGSEAASNVFKDMKRLLKISKQG